jgi:hypothetical protein
MSQMVVLVGVDEKGFRVGIIIRLPSGKVLLTAPLKNHGIFEMMKS